MATRLTLLSLNAVSKQILHPQKVQVVKNVAPSRTVICSETGAINKEPEITKLGMTKVMAVVLPFLTIGGILSREFATLLEEHEIFAPDDDDD